MGLEKYGIGERENEFRAWSRGEMNYVVELPYNSSVDLNEQIEEIQGRNVLMEYTGLKDKNGKEIYEGDIVKISNSIYHKSLEVVSWDNKGFWRLSTNEETPIESMLCFCLDGEVEVVGNVFEDLELLENKNNI